MTTPVSALPDGATFTDAIGRTWSRVRATGDCDGSILCRLLSDRTSPKGLPWPEVDYFAPTAPVTEVSR